MSESQRRKRETYRIVDPLELLDDDKVLSGRLERVW